MTIDQLYQDHGCELPAYAWPGGYPVFYMDKECNVLCPKCANESFENEDELEQYRPIAHGINWENDDLTCDQCNGLIESAYGNDEE